VLAQVRSPSGARGVMAAAARASPGRRVGAVPRASRCRAPAPAGTRLRPRPSAAAAAGSVSEAFAASRAEGRAAFVPFIVAGDPDLGTTEAALRALDDAGAAVIELGVPYTDPLADGPTIQAAAARALDGGATLDDCLELVGRVAPSLSAPVVLFTYYNPILKQGVEAFAGRVAAAGAKGLLVPDIPLEETGDVRAACEAVGVELVLLCTPATPRERMARIAESSQGFVYLVSVNGVTGVKEAEDAKLSELVAELKGVTDKPVAVGFGVSRPEQAASIASMGADGVIVGSALVKALGTAETPQAGLAALAALAGELRGAIPASAKP